MQDWHWEIDCTSRIEELIEASESRSDLSDDEQFALMNIVINAFNDLLSAEKASEMHWERIKRILRSDWALHEYTVHYWCTWDTELLEDCFTVGARMRELAKSHEAGTDE